MFPKLTIQEGAIFISDSHDDDKRDFFLQFLLHVEEVNPKQLFLMGDMFDLLVGDVAYGVQKYQKYIQRIDEIAQKIEVWYFEGNHDFRLQQLFHHVHVIPLSKQPLLCKLPDGQECLLSHGDKFGNRAHRFFTAFIRNPKALWILNQLDKNFNFFISCFIENNQSKKNICQTIDHFEMLVEGKIDQYKPLHVPIIAEGHYHQNRSFKVRNRQYINFSSFACNQSYFIVQSSPETEFAEKQLRGCDG